MGNFFTVCVVFGNILRFAGTLTVTAQTRQDSETTHTGRTPHPPSFAPALATNRHRASSSLVCTTRGVHFVDFWPHTGPVASIPAPHEQNLAVLPHFVAVNSQEEGYGWGCGIVCGCWVLWSGVCGVLAYGLALGRVLGRVCGAPVPLAWSMRCG